MADVTSTSNVLSVVAEFTDGDDRNLTFPNPKSGLSWADIEALNASASYVLIGDRNAANFYRFKEASVKETRTTHLDIS